MKIKIEQSIAGHEFSYAPGDTPDIENELAAAWIQSGVASRIAPTPKTKEYAVAPKVAEVSKAAPAPTVLELETKLVTDLESDISKLQAKS